VQGILDGGTKGALRAKEEGALLFHGSTLGSKTFLSSVFPFCPNPR